MPNDVLSDDLDPIIQAELEAKRARFKATVSSAVTVNPDDQAKYNRIATFLDQPKGVVVAMPADAERSAAIKKIADDASTSAVLQKKYSDADFAKLAHDDSGVLSSIAAAAKYLVSAPDASSTLMGDIAGGYHGANSGVSGAFGGVARTVGAPLDWLDNTAMPGGNPLRRLSEGFMGIADSEAAAQKTAQGKSETWLGGAVSSGVQSLSQNILMLPMALLPGGQAATLTGMASMAGGQSYQKDMADGVPHWKSMIHGVSDGVIEAGTELMPLGNLVHDVKAGTPLFTTILKNAWAENKGEQIATALQDLNDWAINDVNKGKTFGDYLAARPEAAAQTLIATLIGAGGNVTLMHGVQGAADRAAGFDRQAQVAEQHAQVLETMQATMQASKLLERSPDTLRSYAQDLADEGVPTVYVDSAKLVEAGVDLQALAQAVPSVAAQLEQAHTGGDLAIPTGELLTNTIGTEFAQPLIDHARTDVNGMSRSEATTYMQEKGDALNAEIEKVMTAKENDAEFKAGRDQVQAQILTQLNDIKRFTPKVNEQYATLAANFYAVTAARAGMTVQDFADKYKLGFSSNEVAGGMYDQGGKLATESQAFKDWFGDSKVVGTDGKPLVVYHGTAADFTEFKRTSGGEFGPAIYATDNPREAGEYGSGQQKPGVNVMPLYVSMYHPYTEGVDKFWQDFGKDDGDAAAIERARNAGYDGVIAKRADRYYDNEARQYVDQGGELTHYIVFDPTQVKSIFNRGTWNPNDANILSQAQIEDPKVGVSNVLLTLGQNDDLYQYPRSDALDVRDIAADKSWVNDKGEVATIQVSDVDKNTDDNELWMLANTTPVDDAAAGTKSWILTLPTGKHATLTTKGGEVYINVSGVGEGNGGSAVYDLAANYALNNGLVFVGDPNGVSPAAMRRRLENMLSSAIKYGTTDHLKPHPDQYLGDESIGVPPLDWTNGDTLGNIRSMVDVSIAATEHSNPNGASLVYDSGTDSFKDSTTGEPIGTQEIAELAVEDRGTPGTGKAGSTTLQRTALFKSLVQSEGARSAFLESVRGQQDSGSANPSGALAGTFYQGNVKPGFDQTQTEAFKRWSNDAPLVDSASAETHEFKTGQKLALEAYHGTARPDRVGTVFQKKRATSGPMAFFTSNPELASSYAKGKADTSLANEDQDYANWFKFKPQGQRSSVDLVRAWYSLDSETKNKIAELAPRVTYGEEQNEDGSNAIVLGDEGHTNGTGSYDYNLQQTQRGYDKRGNPLKALVEDWLNSGNLFNDEEQFMKVLQLAGFPVKDITYDSPHSAFPFVYKTYIEMQNPLVTSDVPQAVVDALKAAAKKDRSRAASGGADMWDKNTRTLKEWVANYTDPANASAAFVWTSIPDKVTDIFKAMGYDGIVDWSGKGGGAIVSPVYIPFAETQVKSAIGNKGKFDGSKKDILKQDARGQIAFANDITQQASVMSLLKNADLSTFIHESGHFFLEVQTDLANRIAARAAQGEVIGEGERSIMDDMNKTLAWMGVKATPEMSALDHWAYLSPDEKRPYHEQWARGFEAYAFEGKAPSLDLQHAFQTFRAWLVNVYRALLKSVNASKTDVAGAMKVELSDEVRSVMDRMLATSDQIAEAEAARDMGPLFKTAEEAGMTLEEFKAYHDQGTQATMDAVDELQARGLRDMQWLNNARSRKLKELQKMHDALRAQIAREVRSEVMSQPVYRAWTFLTSKATDKVVGEKPPGNAKGLNPEVDNLFTAIAKLGGLDRAEVKKLWGIDEKEKLESGVFGAPVVRKTGGLSTDAMAERLLENGYLLPDENGRADADKFEELFDDQRRGTDRYSIQRDMAAAYGDAPLNLPELPEVGFGKLRTEELRRRYGTADDAVWRKLSELRMTSDEGGLDPDVVGELFGFSSGDELVKTLAATEPPKSVIEGMTDTRMLQEHGDLATPAGLERAADAAIHNDARARFVATELKALQKAMSVREKVPGQKNTVDVLARAARDYATAIIAKLRVRDIRPGQYAAAEVRSAKAAAKAVGDIAQATMHKRNQLINLYATKAAYAAQDEVKAAVQYFKKFDTVSKALDPEYAEQIHALLERFDLRVSTSLKALDKRKSLVEWAQAQVEQGLEPDIPPELLQEANRKSFKDMTVEEVRGLRDTIKQIEHLGRLKNRLLTAQANRDFQAAVEEISTSINLEAGDRKADTRTPNTVLGAKLVGLKNFWAEHIKTATWARIMDGGKDGGPVWEYLIRTANTAGDTEVVMREKATKELAKLVAPVLKEGKMGGKGEFFPSINRTLNKEAKLAIALNMGNEGNAQRLLGGEGWSVQQLQPVLNSLSAADWQFVQAVWDHFESYRPAIGAKEKRVYGKEPNWVEPTPVHTPYGELRGGYYPIKYDPRASERAESHADAEAAKRQLAGAYTSATTRRSFTKSRVEEVNGRPLLYSLDGIYNGVQEVIHDLTWHEWLIDANKLVRNKKIAEAMRSKYGPDAHQQFKKWLEDNAAGDRGAQGAGEKTLAYIRQGVSVSGLGLNVMSALMQPLGITQSMVRIGPKWVGRGVSKFMGSPIETADAINEKSEFMRTRALTRLREINEVRSQVKGRTAAREAVDASAYFLMMRCQQAVDIPTWWGAYEKAIAEGNDENRAVALSDQAVIDAQGSGGTKDQSAIERGGPGLKLFTTFYSFFNTALNLGVQKTMNVESKAKLAADYLLLYSIPVILGAALKDALTGGDSGDWDDWQHIVKKLVGEHLSFALGLFVGVREVTGAVQAATGTAQFGTDYSGPAGVRMLADLVKLGKQLNQGELDDGLRKAIINTAGELLRLPSAQINRTINGIEALHDGKTQNPGVLLTGYQEPH